MQSLGALVGSFVGAGVSILSGRVCGSATEAPEVVEGGFDDAIFVSL